MSVLVKDMDLPEDCFTCPLKEEGSCNLTYELATDICKRNNNCPLFKVIHCKDCINFLNGHLCSLDKHGLIETKPDDYCSYGEKL